MRYLIGTVKFKRQTLRIRLGNRLVQPFGGIDYECRMLAGRIGVDDQGQAFKVNLGQIYFDQNFLTD